LDYVAEITLLVSGVHCSGVRLDTLVHSTSFHTSHSANRHNVGCVGAGVDCVRGELTNHVWTIKELIEKGCGMNRGVSKIEVGAMALALIGVFSLAGGVVSLWPRWSIASLLNIAFGLFSIFVALRSQWIASGKRPRFTIRTLLIATTLVAVVLGLIVYAARK
jgi:hypothetical protein